ncbi:hypothetical protein CAEBREN_32406 [Caenorhabditis brenneri]|uniref:ERCC1-like central domain-containing protein n=1 Tax=Caenorhabditis brenneri TaxID=135651 RepID=G0P1T9_CAEBE|nr:hypothetical protein CAEBREN_32406 [Caenorhabditis brenneri]
MRVFFLFLQAILVVLGWFGWWCARQVVCDKHHKQWWMNAGKFCVFQQAKAYYVDYHKTIRVLSSRRHFLLVTPFFPVSSSYFIRAHTHCTSPSSSRITNELVAGEDDEEAKEKKKTTQFPSSSSSSDLTGGVGVGGGSGALVVNRRRQEGNPVLKYVRNVRYEWGDIGPDFECGPTFGIVYLSFKYHKQHPEYVYTRINGKAENRYRNKVLLGYCNMEEPRHVLRELNMICFREAWTLVVVEEAAEYIELFKTTQKKEITIKKKVIDDGGDSSISDERRRMREAAIGFLTAARSITKTDADR